MFIQVIQGNVRDAGQMRSALDWWTRELAPGAEGWRGTTAGVTPDGRFVSVVRFESAEAARRNSGRPEQTRWWAETAKLFTGQPVFHDCPQVEEMPKGGSDEAGFVQVIQGRIKDAARMSELMRAHEQEMAAYRPDVIGGTIALHGDGTYTQTIYFTSEKEAREGENKPPPEELRAVFEEQMGLSEGEPTFFDLREPWLYSPGR